MEAPRSNLPANNNFSTKDMNQFITGYYAIANCYIVDTQSKERNSIYRNYKVKKVPLGMPSVFGSLSN
jgi:hypothetical protein